MTIQAGSTDQYATVQIMNTDGTAKTDVTSATSGLSIKYQLDNGTVVTLTPVAMSAGGAHADGGIYHIDGGRYKIGLPDAAVSAVGKLCVWTTLTDTEFVEDEIAVVAYDATDGIRMGMTALPAALPENAGGIVVSTSGDNADIDTIFDAIAEIESRLTAARAAYLDNLNGHTAQTGDVFAALPTNFAALAITASTGRVTVGTNVDKSGYSIAGTKQTLDALNDIASGAAMTLTAGERTSLAQALEAAIINELDGTAVMQAIADLIASSMTTGDLSVQAIAAATRDLILNRVLAGNHDTAGTVGKQLQDTKTNTDDLLSDLENKPTAQETLTSFKADATFTTLFSDAAASKAAAESNQTIASKLDAMLELDGAVHRFTTNALEQGPAGGGGGGDITSIMGTNLTETSAGRLAAAFSHFNNVLTPNKTVNDVGVAGSGLSAEDVWQYVVSGQASQAGALLVSAASGSIDEAALASNIAAVLAGVPINVLSVYDTSTKRLELVEAADYQSSGASQAIEPEVSHPGIVDGDTVYFGAEYGENESDKIGPIAGTIIDDAGQLKARFEIAADKLVGKTPSEHWEYTIVHRKDGITTPLAASAPMTLRANQVGAL